MAAAFATCAQADTFTLTLAPTGGVVAGLPGTAVGWGFTLTDTSTSNWVVLNDSYFVGSPVYGSYADYVSAAFYVAGPAPESSTVQQAWDQTLQLGLGTFTIYGTDPVGIVTSGTINVDYSVFSQDPNSPSFDPSSFLSSGTFSDPVQIQVAPEPASWILLIGAGLAAFMLPGLRRKLARR
jgi:hypothetical protein